MNEIEVLADQKGERTLSYRPLGDNSVADVLNLQSGIYLRENSSGNLSTISVFGLPTRFSELKWNGIRLNSRMNGFKDFNLLSANIFTDLEVDPFGTIHIQNTSTANITDIGLRLGSFKLGAAYISTKYEKNKLTATFRVDLSDAENDFPYQNFNDETERLDNADAGQGQLSLNMSYALRENVTLHFDNWYHYARREIPPTLLQNNAVAYQIDSGLNTYLSADIKREKSNLKFYTAHISENIYYNDSIALIDAINEARTVIAGAKLEYDVLPKLRMSAEPTIERTKAYSDSYFDANIGSNTIRESLHGIDTKAKITFIKNLNLLLNFKLSSIDRERLPFIYKLSSDYTVFKNWTLKGAYSKSFLRPTINDRYWLRGGNPDLETEYSERLCVGLSYSALNLLKLEIGYFNSNIDNQIRWIPGSANWNVTNVRKYYSQGYTASVKVTKDFNRLTARLLSHYQYTDAKDESTTGEEVYPLYIPAHKWTNVLRLSYQKYSLILEQLYVSEVNTRTDGLDPLDAYLINNLKLRRTFSYKEDIVGLALSLNNILNAEYQITRLRPMPGRNFLLTFNYTFNNE